MARQAAKTESLETETGSDSPRRTAVSLLLIFHLFALAIGVAAAARPISPLRNKLADVPFIRTYLELLHMDLAYNFHLTDGTEADIDHFLVVEPQGSVAAGNERPGGARMELPVRGLQPGIRRERFQQLAWVAAAGQSPDPTMKTLLPKAIAAGLLRHHDAPPATYRMRILRQTIVARANADSPDPSLSDPYGENRYETAYEGAVILGEDQVEFLEIAPEAQAAGLREDDASPAERAE